ncbi:hypothetical protein EYF80_003149 [Liparis tanakae]|uniref:Uncharacterized protein n=1 Tax=Liparis tanakae TaxID=230148 RepID=A0A4Z2J9T3_9TELE|nr:hypothetical protein EYF80_003149 [Liparis tanakae]
MPTARNDDTEPESAVNDTSMRIQISSGLYCGAVDAVYSDPDFPDRLYQDDEDHEQRTEKRWRMGTRASQRGGWRHGRHGGCFKPGGDEMRWDPTLQKPQPLVYQLGPPQFNWCHWSVHVTLLGQHQETHKESAALTVLLMASPLIPVECVECWTGAPSGQATGVYMCECPLARVCLADKDAAPHADKRRSKATTSQSCRVRSDCTEERELVELRLLPPTWSSTMTRLPLCPVSLPPRHLYLCLLPTCSAPCLSPSLLQVYGGRLALLKENKQGKELGMI